MAQDKKFYIAVLLITLIVVINYGYRNFYYNQNRLAVKNNYVMANKSFDYIVVGGSNGKWGIDTSDYKSFNSDIANVSIPSGGFVFKNYADHLKNLNIKSKNIIYSSYDILQLNKNASLDEVGLDLYGAKINRHFFASHRLINSIQKNIKNTLKTYNLIPDHYQIDNLGNFHNFNCNFNKKLDPVKPGLFDEDKANEFIKRVSTLKSVFGASDVILRFPIIYINGDRQAEWEQYIDSLRKFCLKNNIHLYISAKPLYTDQAYFCNYAHHPNEKLQQKISDELFVDFLHLKLK